ncbi:MAG: four helix bundle protein [Muribaculaceae bacterium]|nr:four helix bundle protein [Muribaculaceae bacterium]
MKELDSNSIASKSKAFAVRIINLYQYLGSKRIYALAEQVLRSGTSIGANVREAVYGYSKSDFTFKMTTALKEASETQYWLELLHETGYLNDKQFESMTGDCNEIVKLLTSIIKTSKNSAQN